MKKLGVLFAIAFAVLGLAWHMPAMAVTAAQQAAKSDALNYGKQGISAAQGSITAPNVSAVPQYQGTNPSQTSYYGNPSSIDQNASGTGTPTAQFLTHSALSRPQFVIDKNTDPLAANASTITSDPQAVIGQLTDTYSGCQSISTQCKKSYQDQTCNETLKTEDGTCTRTENVTVGTVSTCDPSKVAYQTTWEMFSDDYFFPASYFVTVTIGCADTSHIKITFNNFYFKYCTTSGCTTYPEAFTPGSITVPLNTAFDYPYFTYTLVGTTYTYSIVGSTNCTLNTCSLYATTTITNLGAYAKYYTFYPLTSTFTAYDRTAQVTGDTWDSTCSTYQSQTTAGLCTLDSSTCVDGPSTKTINGLPVTRSCWQYQDKYTCSAGPSANNCAPLRQQGCDQINSKCLYAFPDGTCSVFTQTMRCPTTTCANQNQVVCGDQSYCINGNCFNQNYTPDGEFANAATNLAILDGAAKDLNSTTLQIFTGQGMTCTVDLLSFSDCCTLSGWGQSADLTSCSQEEAKLASARNASRCHYVGTYCSKSLSLLVGSVCTQNTQTYCCFDSKLARVVQEQGRPQLGWGWGTAQAPQCQGFTPKQLSALDFSKMNLSELYPDIVGSATIPDPTTLQQQIENKIQQFYNN